MTAEDYMRQACHTAHDYMLRAAKDIDAIFGEGFSDKHPELVGEYLRTAAQDFHTAILTQQTIPDLGSEIALAINTHSEAVIAAAETVAEAIKSAARHLGTNDAATSMGALEHVAKELRDGLQAVAEAMDHPVHITGDYDGDTPIHVQVWGSDECGEQVHTVRVRKVNAE